MKIKAGKDAEHSLGIGGEVGGEKEGNWQLYPKRYRLSVTTTVYHSKRHSGKIAVD